MRQGAKTDKVRSTQLTRKAAAPCVERLVAWDIGRERRAGREVATWQRHGGARQRAPERHPHSCASVCSSVLSQGFFAAVPRRRDLPRPLSIQHQWGAPYARRTVCGSSRSSAFSSISAMSSSDLIRGVGWGVNGCRNLRYQHARQRDTQAKSTRFRLVLVARRAISQQERTSARASSRARA